MTVGRLSADSRSTYRPTVDRLSVDTQSADCRSTVGQRSTDSRLTVGESAFPRNPSVPSQEWKRASFSWWSWPKHQTPRETKPVLMSHWKAREWLRCGQVTRVLSWVNFGGVALYSKSISCWSQTDLSLIQKEHSKPASSVTSFILSFPTKPISIFNSQFQVRTYKRLTPKAVLYVPNSAERGKCGGKGWGVGRGVWKGGEGVFQRIGTKAACRDAFVHVGDLRHVCNSRISNLAWNVLWRLTFITSSNASKCHFIHPHGRTSSLYLEGTPWPFCPS